MGFGSLFSFKRLQEELIVVLDIGSASIGGALVLFSSAAHPTVIYTVRREMKFKEKVDFKNLVLSMEETLDLVLLDIQKEGLAHARVSGKMFSAPEKAYCVLGAPWYASQVRVIKESRETLFRVNQNSLSEILAREVNSFKDSESERYLHEGILRGDIDLIEKETLSVKLNGYEVQKPYDRLTRRMEMLLYLSLAPREILETVREKIGRLFHLENIEFHSLSLASWSTVRDIWEKEKDFLFVDVGGEMTEVLLVRHGVPQGTISFPLGKNFFVRKIAHRLRTTSHEATSLLTLYLLEKGSEEVTQQITDVLENIKKEWQGGFVAALREISEGLYLPPRVFLTAHSVFEPLFSQSIQNTIMSTDDISAESFSVLSINYGTLSQYVYIGGNLQKDPFLLLFSLFAHKMHILKNAA